VEGTYAHIVLAVLQTQPCLPWHCHVFVTFQTCANTTCMQMYVCAGCGGLQCCAHFLCNKDHHHSLLDCLRHNHTHSMGWCRGECLAECWTAAGVHPWLMGIMLLSVWRLVPYVTALITVWCCHRGGLRQLALLSGHTARQQLSAHACQDHHTVSPYLTLNRNPSCT
jgi:hypothetical protein